MLVYENYSKFISATDTIRKMKNNVNDMKSEMDSLVKNMEGISTRMQSINSFLSGKRAKVSWRLWAQSGNEGIDHFI